MRQELSETLDTIRAEREQFLVRPSTKYRMIPRTPPNLNPSLESDNSNRETPVLEPIVENFEENLNEQIDLTSNENADEPKRNMADRSNLSLPFNTGAKDSRGQIFLIQHFVGIFLKRIQLAIWHRIFNKRPVFEVQTIVSIYHYIRLYVNTIPIFRPLAYLVKISKI